MRAVIGLQSQKEKKKKKREVRNPMGHDWSESEKQTTNMGGAVQTMTRVFEKLHEEKVYRFVLLEIGEAKSLDLGGRSMARKGSSHIGARHICPSQEGSLSWPVKRMLQRGPSHALSTREDVNGGLLGVVRGGCFGRSG